MSPALRVLLILSLLANVVLLVLVIALARGVSDTYADYRQFRTLSPHQSDASRYNATGESGKLIVMFGDSRVSEWFPLPRIAPYKTINAGVNGESTAEMRRRFQYDVLRLKPAVVFIQAGINDISAAATRSIVMPDQIIKNAEKNLRFFVQEAQRSGASVVLSAILKSGDLNIVRRYFWPRDVNRMVDEMNQKLASFARENKVLWFDPNPLVNKTLYKDTLHLSAMSYPHLNIGLQKMLDQAINGVFEK